MKGLHFARFSHYINRLALITFHPQHKKLARVPSILHFPPSTTFMCGIKESLSMTLVNDVAQLSAC